MHAKRRLCGPVERRTVHGQLALKWFTGGIEMGGSVESQMNDVCQGDRL